MEKHETDNYANQLNSNNKAYWSSRGIESPSEPAAIDSGNEEENNTKRPVNLINHFVMAVSIPNNKEKEEKILLLHSQVLNKLVNNVATAKAKSDVYSKRKDDFDEEKFFRGLFRTFEF